MVYQNNLRIDCISELFGGYLERYCMLLDRKKVDKNLYRTRTYRSTTTKIKIRYSDNTKNKKMKLRKEVNSHP